MVVTNAEELAKDIMRKIRSLMREDWYEACFRTRLAKGHQAVMHFGTTAGGTVYAAPIRGALTGFGADVIIVDDLHDIADARNPSKMADDIDLLETVVASRFNKPSSGRMMVIAHRISLDDVSGHLLAQDGWRHVVLPLIASRDQIYDTDRGPWLRHKGELLRPDAWGSPEINARKARTRMPDFETLYQQNPSHGLRPVTPECFPETTWGKGNKVPLVMSVDPGQSGGRNNSFSVVQIWGREGENHILVDQWREQGTFSELQKACRQLLRRYRPSAILIENAGQGPALASTIRPQAWMRIQKIQPRASKVERLARHVDFICSGGIRLAISAEAQLDYVQEFASFPRSDHDDQIDATTQYLEFMAKRPHLELPPERALASVVTYSA